MSIRSRIRILSLILALTWPISSVVASPTLLFQNYTSDDGLPNMGISSFAQDRYGSVWVGTIEGICMFDGESFITPGFLQQEPFLSASLRGMCIDSRNVLWLGSRDGLLTCNLDTGETRVFKDYSASMVLCDGDGIIWLRSSGGLISYDAETGEWDSSFADSFTPVSICINSSGELCATATDGSIYWKKRGQSSFTGIRILSDEVLGNGLSLERITACDERRVLYSTSDNSVFCLDLFSGTSKKFFDGHLDGNDAILSEILARNSREFWVITDNGLFIYDDHERTCTRYMNSNGNPYSLASSKLRCLFKDRQDRIWIGTFYDGVSRLIETGPDTRIFRMLPEDPEHSLDGKTVSSICSGDYGTVWVATEDGFLGKIYPDGRVTSFGRDHNASSRSNTYQSIAFNDGRVYVADLGDGLSIYDSESLQLLRRYDVGGNYCRDILFTTRNETLVGASDGLYRLDRTSDSFVLMDSIPAGFVYTMCEDRLGNIWIEVFRQGIYVLSPSGDKAYPLEITGGDDVSTSNISHLYEDRDGRILAASGGDGLLIFKPELDTPWKVRCTRISRDDGLPSDMCRAVTQDKTGTIWVSTINGIASIDSDAVTAVKGYKAISNYFCAGSVLNSPDGMIYMGSSDGMVAFNPERVPERKHKLFLADIITARDNSFTSVSEEGHSAFTSGCIRVHSYETSSLTIRLICLKTDINEVTRYRYSLTGKGRDIISLSNEKQMTYTNLTPGKYVFTASVDRDDSPDASASLKIRVIPPIYASLPAKLLYALLILGIIASLIGFRTALIRKDKERAIEKLEAFKQKEIYESKINFFTNISHEIRTPLTLIKVPLDKILESKAYLPEAEYDLQCIRKSTDTLLDMTDQILDFRRMENGSASLTFSRTDLTKLVSEVLSRMEALAKEYDVALDSELPEDPVFIMCAPGSVDKIISNLLMNGIKYCRSAVSVKLEKTPEDTVRISVDSDGAPIAQEEREKIFEPFYQSPKIRSRLPMNEGTGLGLSLARSLAVLHEGSLILDPAYQDGNSFVLELPVGHPAEMTETEEEEEYLPGQEQESGKYSILIVEDDTTLNDYIRTELSGEYTIYQAYNGKQALSILNEKSISLIVSDIMMPEMNGCELVDVVKNTLRFSHVPIILLTAVTDYNTQLESLHSGADGYITKPFSMQILRATIFNTLKNREIIYERFSSMPYTRPENTTSSQDDAFMKHLYDYVMENVSNQDFSVLDLAEKMNTSRSTLFRKVRANTGMNINEYIRVCRLKKAAELLSTQKYQIKEVAYMVGFTTMSYFTKSFQKQFNIAPSSLLKKKNNDIIH